MDSRTLNLFGYAAWIVGCALFAFVGWRNDDAITIVASLLFLAGACAMIVPVIRSDD